MASRTWLAVALSCLVWFGYLKWFAPLPPTQSENSTPAQGSPSKAGEQNAASAPVSSNKMDVGLGRSGKPGSIVEIKNSRLNLEFGSESGDVHRAYLTEFHEGLSSDSANVSIVSPSVNPSAFAVQFSDPELKKAFLEGAYLVQKTENSIRFEKKVGAFSLTKRFILGEDYFLESEVGLELSERSDGNWGHLIIPVGGRGLKSDANDPMKTWEVVFTQNDKTSRVALDSIGEETVHQGSTHWLAFGNRYFTGVLINQSELNPDIVVGTSGEFSGGYMRYPLIKKGASRYQFKQKYYLGPKDLRYFDKEPSLSTLLDHGMFSFLAKPILYLLNFFYKFIRNYGVAIILLTILVKGLFYPLSVKSYRSMKSMQKLQPQLQVLKAKYKDDQQRYNQEQMALFKAHGVNPAGGCIPMLVQLPVFIALYAVLQNSIELFHAPFFGWVKDLSAKDPYYIYPVLMGASMFIQQKMTPTPGMDPMQQKIMYVMPVVFSFMMFNLPSGLTMYIFLSTILGILQQWTLNRDKHTQVATASGAA